MDGRISAPIADNAQAGAAWRDLHIGLRLFDQILRPWRERARLWIAAIITIESCDPSCRGWREGARLCRRNGWRERKSNAVEAVPPGGGDCGFKVAPGARVFA